jgi:hypothetical protein
MWHGINILNVILLCLLAFVLVIFFIECLDEP